MAGLLDIDSMPEPARSTVLRTVSALPPPDGIVSDFTNSHHRADIAIAVTTTFMVLSTTAFVTRYYSQFLMGRLFAFPNVLGIIGFGAYCGLVGTTFRLVVLKTFWNHTWNFSLMQISDVLFELYLQPLFYCVLTCFIKPTILYEWKRIFVPRGVHNGFTRTCNVLIIISILFYNAYFIALQFYCRPYRKIWRRWATGTCFDRGHLDIPCAVFNLVLDLFIFALPQRIIWGLQTTRIRRLGITIVFSVGLLAVGCAAGLVYTLSQLNYSSDFMHDQGPAIICLLAESTCVMLVFCVPMIPKALEDTWILRILGPLSEYPLSIVQGRKASTKERLSTVGGKSTHWNGWVFSRVFRGSDSKLSSTSGDGLHRDHDDSSQIGLARLDPVAKADGPNGILRTTEISMEVSAQSGRPWDGSEQEAAATEDVLRPPNRVVLG
ncbi:hypothetical protein B0I35DRAFT_436071 [Stachybotrys elegans]|uniref:Rhodopsin domain-containing protein n=1 Tax=Stachybotrys elegans TaxID=80388 RepID=A0A8K0SP18_9HYPO|nr:hypothetical protein B0I35DRAFT_436071 [Stachybotrys elegans]